MFGWQLHGLQGRSLLGKASYLAEGFYNFFGGYFQPKCYLDYSYSGLRTLSFNLYKDILEGVPKHRVPKDGVFHSNAVCYLDKLKQEWDGLSSATLWKDNERIEFLTSPQDIAAKIRAWLGPEALQREKAEGDIEQELKFFLRLFEEMDDEPSQSFDDRKKKFLEYFKYLRISRGALESEKADEETLKKLALAGFQRNVAFAWACFRPVLNTTLTSSTLKTLRTRRWDTLEQFFANPHEGYLSERTQFLARILEQKSTVVGVFSRC